MPPRWPQAASSISTVMRTLLLGTSTKLAALEGHAIHQLQPTVVEEDSDAFFEINFTDYEFIIDLNLDDDFDRMEQYAELSGVLVLGSALKKTLREMLFLTGSSRPTAQLFGLNAWVGFIDQPSWEVSALVPAQAANLTEVLARVGIGTHFVEDHVGLVAPRVLAMILNEAHFMLQEGLATEADIDIAMKAGVNYPYGPFEWTERIGIRDLYELLAALREELGDDTYKISALLQRRYYESFYA